MMSQVLIGGIMYNAQNVVMADEEDMIFERMCKEISMDITVVGHEAADELRSFLKNRVTVSFPETEETYECTVENHSYTYAGSNYDDYEGDVDFHIKLEEYIPGRVTRDKDLQVNAFYELVFTWCRTRAISELLVDKGIISKEEYEDRIQQVVKRDYKEMVKKLYTLSEKE